MYYLKKVVVSPQNGESKEYKLGEDFNQTDAVLWITDSSVKAKALKREGKAVLIWLHEANRNQDFSGFQYACDNPAALDRDYLEGIYRRYKGIPWQILETEHCLVRETTVEDVEAFYQIYSHPSITEYMESLYEDPEEERAYARDYIEKVYSFYGFGIWTVAEKLPPGEEGEVIGRAGICYREGYEDPEMGFMIAAHKQGRGYATQVCRAILEYGHTELGFEKILAFVRPENQASVRVCEKLGMVRGERTQIQKEVYDIWYHEQIQTK